MQVQFFRDKCIGCRKCNGIHSPETARLCPAEAISICGREIGEEELLTEVLRDRSFYGETGGVTFSGGECLLQADFVAAMLRRLRAEGIPAAIDTAGYVATEQLMKTVEYCDLYLYDIKCISPELHQKYTGADNSLILHNLRFLSEAGKRLWIRTPVIPGVNDNAEEIGGIAETVRQLKGVERVTLMPYHTLGRDRYETLGYPPAFTAPSGITHEAMDRFRAMFASKGIPAD